ncbi:hypothetical protein CKF54_02185 [Psittacicella hinzii]|uniref:Chorismate lyase n=1 Tax=Psittacicella hinzii TaxID=2028575 RepID=A0A3A1Y8Y7_9GAMM|nr:hypothetical protein [Psittacicella hinzii]RIY33786.1 hypothetical protein CKF54_02185 [Psittacicella hinzii]
MEQFSRLLENIIKSKCVDSFTNDLNQIQKTLEEKENYLLEAKAVGVDYPDSITALIEAKDGELPRVIVNCQKSIDDYLIRFINLINKDNNVVLTGYTFLDLSHDLNVKKVILSELTRNQTIPLGLWLFKQQFTASEFIFRKSGANQFMRIRYFDIDCSKYVNYFATVRLYLVEVFNIDTFIKYIEKK